MIENNLLSKNNVLLIEINLIYILYTIYTIINTNIFTLILKVITNKTCYIKILAKK